MYTRAKEIGGKVMAGGENNIDAACMKPDVAKYMAILVYGPCSAHFTPKTIIRPLGVLLYDCSQSFVFYKALLFGFSKKIQASPNDRFGVNACTDRSKEADTVAKRCLPLISLTSPRLSLSCSYRESRA